MKEQKLVITGMGAVTPIGIGVDAYWSALVEEKLPALMHPNCPCRSRQS